MQAAKAMILLSCYLVSFASAFASCPAPGKVSADKVTKCAMLKDMEETALQTGNPDLAVQWTARLAQECECVSLPNQNKPAAPQISAEPVSPAPRSSAPAAGNYIGSTGVDLYSTRSLGSKQR